MKRGMMSTMQKIAKIIRAQGELDKADFVIKCDLSPSTFYNYKDLILRLNNDIIFEDGKFKAVKTELFENEI